MILFGALETTQNVKSIIFLSSHVQSDEWDKTSDLHEEINE